MNFCFRPGAGIRTSGQFNIKLEIYLNMAFLLRFASMVALTAATLLASATPSGAPPQAGMRFYGDFWDCELPLTIAVQSPIRGLTAPSQKSPTTANFSKAENIRVLKVTNIVIEPGVAVVKNSAFENNNLQLAEGAEVFVLADWEFLYFHAWLNGREVDGGLPIGDESYFSMVKVPKIERWILVQKQKGEKAKSWVRDGEALRDDSAIQSCARILRH